jgi:hypothetical protein
MKARRDIERRIEKEQQQIIELNSQIEHAEFFIKGLQEALKMLPKDNDSKARKGKGTVRPGSDMAKIRDLIRQAGKPLRIEEILIGLGKSDTKANRMSIAGSLGRYVRKSEIFNRVGPNLFSLIDMEVTDMSELPPDFGSDELKNIQPEELPF